MASNNKIYWLTTAFIACITTIELHASQPWRPQKVDEILYNINTVNYTSLYDFEHDVIGLRIYYSDHPQYIENELNIISQSNFDTILHFVEPALVSILNDQKYPSDSLVKQRLIKVVENGIRGERGITYLKSSILSSEEYKVHNSHERIHAEKMLANMALMAPYLSPETQQYICCELSDIKTDTTTQIFINRVLDRLSPSSTTIPLLYKGHYLLTGALIGIAGTVWYYHHTQQCQQNNEQLTHQTAV